MLAGLGTEGASWDKVGIGRVTYTALIWRPPIKVGAVIAIGSGSRVADFTMPFNESTTRAHIGARANVMERRGATIKSPPVMGRAEAWGSNSISRPVRGVEAMTPFKAGNFPFHSCARPSANARSLHHTTVVIILGRLTRFRTRTYRAVWHIDIRCLTDVSFVD